MKDPLRPSLPSAPLAQGCCCQPLQGTYHFRRSSQSNSNCLTQLCFQSCSGLQNAAGATPPLGEWLQERRSNSSDVQSWQPKRISQCYGLKFCARFRHQILQKEVALLALEPKPRGILQSNCSPTPSASYKQSARLGRFIIK